LSSNISRIQAPYCFFSTAKKSKNKIISSITFSLGSDKNIPGLKKMSRIFKNHLKAKKRKAKAKNKKRFVSGFLLKAKKAITAKIKAIKKTKNFTYKSMLAANSVKGLKKSQKYIKPP